MEQTPSRGHEASLQSGLGVSCKLCSSSKKLRGLCVRAQVRRISIPPLFSVEETPKTENMYQNCAVCQNALLLGQHTNCLLDIYTMMPHFSGSFPAPLVKSAQALGGFEARVGPDNSPCDAFWRVFLSEVAAGRRKRLAVGKIVASDVIFFCLKGVQRCSGRPVGAHFDVYAAREVPAFKSTTDL